ncbi:MAG: hypothetical protein FWJ70_11425 [Micromonosporaceae bacterium]
MSGWLVPVAIFFMIFGLPAVVRIVEGRRKFLLDLKREERRIAEARAKELELEHKRRELEYREALLELERFDRRERGLLPPEPGSPTQPQPRPGPAAESAPEQPPEPEARSGSTGGA